MAERPSFLNLDQAQNDLQSIQGKMKSEMSNFESQTIQKTKNAINSISNELQNLQNSLSSQNVMGPLKSEMEKTIELFQKFKDVGNQAIANQKREVELFTNNISQMYESIKKSYEAMQQFNSIQIGDVQQINDFERSINNLKSSFEDFVSTSDIINIEQSDLDAIRQRMMDFMKSLSVEGTKAFNLAEMMTTATQDPTLKMALTNMLVPLNEAISQIPNNVIDSFVKTQNQMSGGSTNIVQDLINSLNSFSGVVNAQGNNGMGVYNANFAAQQAEIQKLSNSRASTEAETATVSRLNSHFDKMFSSNHYASNVDSTTTKMGNTTIDLDSKIEKLLESLNIYSKGDLSRLSKIGMDNNGINNLKTNSGEIQKLLSNYKLRTDGAANAVNDYKSAGANYYRNSSPENLQRLIESEKKVKEEAQGAAAALDELMGFTSKYVTELDIDAITFKRLPTEMKEVLVSMNDIFNANLESGSDLLKLYEAFGISLDNIGENLKKSMNDAKSSVKEMNNQMSSNGGFFSGLFGDDSKILKSLGTIGKIVGGVASGVGGYYGTLNKFGLNPGIPSDLNGIYRYFSGGSEWYQKFGQMNYQGAIAQTAQGGGINDAALDRYRDTGKELYRMTSGQITNEDYYNTMTKLLTEVQGHYGQGSNKQQGMDDLEGMSKMAVMIQEVYGVDSINTINAFYKELNMGTSEVNDLLGKLVENAEMANIPINQYIKSISDMSVKFKELGIDVKVVESGMRNLTMEGMSFSMAQDMTASMGNAMNRFTDSPGQMATYGILSGQFSDPWEAMWTMSDRWDENGNLKEGATDAILKSMGTQMDYVSKMWGGNEYAQKFGIYSALTDNYGMKDWQAGVLTNKYVEGDFDSFKDLLEKYFNENAKGEGDIQKDLQEKIEEASSRLDELTKAEAAVTASQQDLATSMESFIDKMLGEMKDSIDGLTGVMNEMLKKFANSSFGQGLAGNMNWLGPLSSGALGLTSVIGGNAIGKKIRKTFKKNGSNRSGDGAAGVADDVADDVTRAANNSADDVIRTTTSAADDVIRATGSGVDDMIRATGSNADDVARVLSTSADDVIRATGNSADDILRTVSGVSSKFLGPLSALISGGFAYGDAINDGKSKGQALTEAGGSALGAGLGGWGGAAAGAAIGSMIFPGVGTIIGGLLGGVIGGWGGEKLGNTVATAGYEHITGETQRKSNYTSPSSSSSTGGMSYAASLSNDNGDINSIMNSRENKNNSKKILDETSGTKSLLRDSNLQSDKNSKEQLSVLGSINNETINTTNEINELTGKTELVEKSLNKNTNNLISILKNEGIKVKNMPSMGYTPNFDSSGQPMFSSGRDKLLADLNNSNNNSLLSSGTGSGGSGATRSISEMAGLSVNEATHRKLNEKTNLTAGDINDWIASKTSSDSKMRGMGEAFIKASEESGLDPLYLVSHAALETGWGTSTILNDKNNWFGIGAFDSSPYESAYGFNNLEAGIVEGAKWISKNYTQKGQDTLHSMRFNNGSHEYATDINWANKIASIMVNGAGGNGSYAPWDGTGPTSGGMNSSMYTEESGKSYEDLIKENTFKSTIFKIGSPEWSNKAQTFNVADYKDYDFGENSSYVYRDAQAMARSTYLSSHKDTDPYKSAIEAYDDRSSAYNRNPQFKININVAGENRNYDAMAKEMQTALSNITLKYMGSSSRIASANYYRANSQY